MLRNQDEDELREILAETYHNTNYVDEEIKHLILTPNEDSNPRLHTDSVSSRRSSESSQHSYWREEQSFNSQVEPRSLSESPAQEKPISKLLVPSEQSQHIFDSFYKTINLNLQAETTEQVRQKYPLFLLSQPQYQINNHIKQVSLNYSGGLIRKNVVVMDAGYCQQQQTYKVAVGTDGGQVIILEPHFSKPQQIIECFGKICNISCVKWSKNMQHLAIANDLKELKIYSFKQAISIETHQSFRLLKSPIEHCSLNEKQLKNIVIQLYFIDETPLEMLLVTENEEILRLQMKRQFLSIKPHLSPLPYKINNFLDIALLNTRDPFNSQGTLIAVSGVQFVTLCLLKPTFQVAMVYDKEKHGGNIKKIGYPQVSFRQKPTSMMVVWEKYLQIIDININSFSPTSYSFSIRHRHLLPDATILAGYLSNSMIYQLTKEEIKFYSVNTFDQQLSKKSQSKSVHQHKLDFNDFCYGNKVSEAIGKGQLELSDLRYIKGLFASTNRMLFISTNKDLQMVSITTLQQYISTLVENSNWKTALELLKDCYRGQVYQLDQLQQQSVLSRIKQLSLRYINFLQTIILSDIASNESNILLLWNQELLFIFNIIVATDQQSFLLDQIIPKIYKLNPTYTQNVVPFILTKKLTQLTPNALEIFLETLPKSTVSKLIFNLQPNNNDIQLPHQINNLLIRQELYLQLIDLNQKFRDHYTPTAVLVSIYLKLQLDNDRNIMQLTEQKQNIAKLIAYSVYDTLYSINFNKYEKGQNKEILATLVPLLTDQIMNILIKEEPTALFQNIVEELYIGSCLQTLNQLDVTGQTDIMVRIVNSIDYHQTVRYGCQKKYWMALLKLYARKIVSVKIYQGLHYLCVQDHIDKDYLQSFIHKCYENVYEELSKIAENVLNPFFESLLQSEHICMVKLVGRILKRYIDVVEAMLRFEEERNLGVYEFLDECLPLLSNLELEVLKTLIKHNIQILTEIDPSKASDIICRHYLSDLNLFIDDLNSYQHQQLKLIHAVLQLYAYKESLLPLKVKYLQLLAITANHDTILSQLMKENYPLDESINICKKYEVLEAYAYLLVKSGGTGNIEAAIRVYFKIIWQKIVKAVLNPLGSFDQLQEIIMHYVSLCIQICIELDLQDHQIQWFNIMQQLQILKKSIFKNLVIDAYTCDLLKDIINKVAYPQLIKMLISQVTYHNIINYLRAKMGAFDLQAIQIVIEEMKRSYLYEKQIHLGLQDIFIHSENILRKRLLKKQLQGFATDDQCDFCMKRGGLLVHYNCGHEVHPSCGQDVRECVLCLEDIEVIYRKRIDSLMKTRVQIYSGGLSCSLQQVEQQIHKQNNLKRMSLYDQLIALSSFQSDM